MRQWTRPLAAFAFEIEVKDPRSILLPWGNKALLYLRLRTPVTFNGRLGVPDRS
jgi:hypothetical protein